MSSYVFNNAELARTDPTYEDMASKFFEHFILIVDAMNKARHGEGNHLSLILPHLNVKYHQCLPMLRYLLYAFV